MWIQRVQNAGTCFLHAPVVTQSYLVRGQLEREAIDIQKYARMTFVDAKVEAMILYDGGGNAFEEFENMLGKVRFSLGPIESHSLEQFRCRCGCDNEILHLLKSHGPALVHVFKVDHNFRSTTAEGEDWFEIPFLTGTIGKVTEKHAMVLVGMRKVSGAWRYLLQNWWPKLQLVEVSEEYFRSSDSSICFVTSKVSSIDKKFALCNSVYAESSLQGQDGNFSTVYER
ncbi:hypothetical protein IV203_023349 [Nitzschia inconspicua]|uniref:Uncharacterized protein n=1 Tax=Nitzschia inconspicua TaxID=303405 RepID=A0A9K3PBE6_9STRA|nr:hypothetical protein IV203_023349 [Nitzschia inconspicua]